MRTYFNDNDEKVCAWLRELQKQRCIPSGVIDDRPIEDVRYFDVGAFDVCHFFAGIGGWQHALTLAGWDQGKVWTASLPCQPFSQAGKQRGTRDDRHLWPCFRALVKECRPPTIFGEQVASKLGRQWLDTVRADLEALGYAVGAADLCAASVGAPHIRQRLYWGARWAEKPRSERLHGRGSSKESDGRGETFGKVDGPSPSRGLADPDGRIASKERVQRSRKHGQQQEDGGSLRGLVHADRSRSQGRVIGGDGASKRASRAPGVGSPWTECDWLPCADGFHRPVEPGTFPLAHGVSGRVGRLRGYGNAIVPQVAAAFISAFMSAA